MKKLAGLFLIAMAAFLPEAEGHDLLQTERLLARSQADAAASRAAAVKQLSAAITDSRLSYGDFNAALDLISRHRLKEMVPALILGMDRLGFDTGSIKPMSQTYPCTRVLVELGQVSVGPLMTEALRSEDQLRQELCVYSLLGLLGASGTKERLDKAAAQPVDENQRRRIMHLLELAHDLAPLAPTHLAP